MDKKQYEKLQIEVFLIDDLDVVTASLTDNELPGVGEDVFD